MALKKKTPDSAFENCTSSLKEKMKQKCIKALTAIGELCLRETRIGGTYTDRTGNLRNSIGYAVLSDGKTVIESEFQQGEGGEKGKQKLSELKSKYNSGIVLIMTTGMNYAAYVEAMGYNVITSAELLAEKLVPSLMKQLGFDKK